MIDPYATPETIVENDASIELDHIGGIGRLVYLVIFVSLLAMWIFVALFIMGDRFVFGSSWILFTCLLIPTFLRFKNIGMPRAWSLLIFIPFMNLFVIARCLILQEDYSKSKKLDRVGKVVLSLLSGLSAFIVLYIVGRLYKVF